MNETDIRAELAMRERLLVTEAAFLFRRSRATIYRWIDGDLPSEEHNGKTWVKRADVATYIATHATRRRTSSAYETT